MLSFEITSRFCACSFYDSLKAENAKLRNDLLDSSARKKSSVFGQQGRAEEDCDTSEALRRNMDKKAPFHQLWRKYEKSSAVRDQDTGASQAQRYCRALELYADVRDSPVRSPDPLCDAMNDSNNAQNQRRVMHGLILWAQMGRSSP